VAGGAVAGWLRRHRRVAVVSAVICGLLAAPVEPAMTALSGPGVGTAELTPATDAAITRNLEFLAARQNKDGSFGNQYHVAMTSLSLMGFMLKGHFPKKGVYGEKLERAVDYLLKQSASGGGYMGQSMYEHALATLALSEAWGMSDRDEIRDVLKRAVEVIVSAQSREGGWRYTPRPESADVSVTVMQIVALVSAKEAGIHVPTKVIENAIKYVKSLQTPSGGFGYQSPNSPGFARSAAGVMSLMMCGERNSPAVARGLEYLKRYDSKKFTEVEYYEYAHYYAIQVMYQAGEADYQQWYPQIRDTLVTRPPDDVFKTAMRTLILGVPYRFLPIYQR
jgi:hypothetical protein